MKQCRTRELRLLPTIGANETVVMAGTGSPLRSRSGDPVVPAIHDLVARKDVDARQRRQVYAVCASLTALPGMTVITSVQPHRKML